LVALFSVGVNGPVFGRRQQVHPHQHRRFATVLSCTPRHKTGSMEERQTGLWRTRPDKSAYVNMPENRHYSPIGTST
jgi:hypothetical protein